MDHPTLSQGLFTFVDIEDRDGLLDRVKDTHPAEIADFLAPQNDVDVWRFLTALPHALGADIFSNLDLDRQVKLASGANRRAMARMLEELPHDDRADLVQRLDEQVAEQILPLVARAEREDIRKLTSYEEGTAGALVNSEYAALRPNISVSQALRQIRVQAPKKETIYYIYVVDEQQRLIGFVSLKDLIMAEPADLVRDVMNDEVISANTHDDQELIARKFEKYDLLAIPVTTSDRKLVGIITHDDALDVIRQEQQEDVEKLMAIGGRHQAGEYLRTSATRHFRNRVVWVVSLGLIGLISGLIVQKFDVLLRDFVILVAFMPMLADTGGNTGSQSATLVVRALALGEVRPRDILKILYKELRIAFMLALVLAFVAFGRVLILGGGTTLPAGVSLAWIGMTISIALGIQVVSATLIGATLPLIAARLKCDPALVASPALTTCVDITGLLIFFGTAKLLLGV